MHRRTAVFALVLGLLGACLAACGGSGSSSRPATHGNEVGVTASTVRIAVFNAQDLVVHGVFADASTTVKAFARTVNAQGGVGGHKIVVDTIDTRLDGDTQTKALQYACDHDFAIIGSPTAALVDVAPIDHCPDGKGKATGLPNFTTITAGPDLRGSPVAYPAIPPERDATVRSQQRYYARTALYSYLKAKLGVTHGVFIADGDSQETREADTPRFYAAQHALGLTADGGTFEVSAFDAANAYGPYVNTIARDRSQFAETGASYQTMIDLRSAAADARVDSVKAWLCTITCYDPKFLADATADGTYLSLPFLPYLDAAELTAVPGLKEYVDAVGGIKHASIAGIEAWTSALLFQRVMSDVGGAHAAITRSAALADVRSIHDFDAGGIIGPTDVGRGRPSPCTVILQARGRAFVRVANVASVASTKPGTFDCTPSNLTTFVHDLWPPWSDESAG